MDGWPQFSDAIVDYYFNKKLAYQYIKRSQQDIILMFKEPADGFLELVSCNDTQFDKELSYEVLDADGSELHISSTAVSKADSVTTFCKLPVQKESRRFLIIKWETAGNKYCNHYLLGKPFFDFEWYKKCLAEFEAIDNPPQSRI